MREGFIERVQGKGAFVKKEVQRPREAAAGEFGLILPAVRGTLYPSLIKGFGEVAGRTQHAMAIFETNNNLGQQADAILQMIDRRVAGVAIVPTTEPMPPHHLRQLEQHDIPVVLCHRGVDQFDAFVVTWPWKDVAKLAAHAIAELGHRRVAFVASVRHRYTELYEESFRQALSEYGIELPPEWVCYNQNFLHTAWEKDVRYSLVPMLTSSDRPTAIFANDLEVGETVYMEALHLGLRVPEDVSIVAFGGKWREGPIREQLAAVTVDEVELGRDAAHLLNSLQVDRSAWGQPRQAILPLEFAAGPSLAAPASAKVGSKSAAAGNGRHQSPGQ